ncbi:MAG TPA: glycosyltransferase family 87 protein [Candidatus Micrarchaeaceae archaeon]|nr:glycosyltransferase family 87 protein [Candidatus Micrarchaeaceae archaeon]
MNRARRLLPPLALAAILIVLLANFINRQEPPGIDYHTYKAAAVVGLTQGWSNIYDQSLVAAAQIKLDPGEVAQPFLSPPTVAWLVAPLVALPYSASYYLWAALVLAAYIAALAWAVPSRGLTRWILVAAAVAPWWVLEAIRVGQVVPLVAVGMAISWRFLRENRNFAAGLALSLLLLKPNTAFLVPLAVLAAGRVRALAALTAVGAVLALAAFVTVGTTGAFDYWSQLTGSLPTGADALTLERALNLRGVALTALRVVIVVAVLFAAFRLRRSPGLVLVVGILGSLVAVPYLHASDLCLLAVASVIVWEERPVLAWRVPIAAGWLLTTPLVGIVRTGLPLQRWPLVELAFLAGLCVIAWRVKASRPTDRVVGLHELPT